jgi:hypothetical protein
MLTAVNFPDPFHCVVHFVRDANTKGASTSPKIAISIKRWLLADYRHITRHFLATANYRQR